MIKKLLFTLLTGSTLAVSAQGNCNATVNTAGYATFYTLLETGASSVVKCSFSANDVKGTFYGALHQTMLNETPAKYCGACVSMTGTAGTATLQIVDECPTCTHSTQDIDLSPQAFAAIVGDQSIGVQNITWKEVACPWSTPIKVIVEGSNQWYAKVIIANHVNRIDKVEVQQGGSWSAMVRGADNGWVSQGGINEATKSFRITDIFGEQVTVSGIDFTANPTNSTTAGTKNFTPCIITSAENINPLDYISVYPNPANDVVSIEGLVGVTSIAVFSTVGEVVATQQLDGFTSNITINVSALSSGVYVLKFNTSNGKVAVKTIVVQ